MILPSPAKINLLLRITGRRPDGYHDLQTAFQFVDLCDELEFELRADTTEIALDAPGINCALDDNLIIRAARALQPHSPRPLGAHIKLHKRIPVGGGLGGGSSNAATTLLALNRLWECNLPLDILQTLSLPLGADVPIFIHGHAAFAEGVGELLQPIAPPERHLVIIYPGKPVNTGEIFSHNQLTRDSSRIKIADLSRHEGENDCEIIAKQLNPSIDEAMRWLGQYTSVTMSGTGSCVFGPFHDQQQAQDVALAIPKPMIGFVAKGMNVSLLHQYLQLNCDSIGTSPSGKAPGFDLGIHRFESCRPSHLSHSIKSDSTTEKEPSCTK